METRRAAESFVRALALLCVAGFIAQSHAQSSRPAAGAHDEDYPVKPIRWLVGFTPGGGTTLVSLLIAQKLTERLGKPVVVDNRPGAEGGVAMQLAQNAAADGYTLFFLSGSSLVKYDVAQAFTGVSQLTSQPYILVVNASFPAKSVQDLIAMARAKPGALNYGSSGTGSLAHLGMELFNSLAEVKTNHVPYKGSGPALIDLVGGRIDLALTSTIAAVPHVKSGKLRALAVSTGVRSPTFPDLPTVAEGGLPGYDVSPWYGVLARKETPPGIIAKLNAEIAAILAMMDVKARLEAVGAEPAPTSVRNFQTKIEKEYRDWRYVIKKSGIQLE